MKNFLLIQFDLHQRLYNNVLEGFSDDETNRRPNGDRNVNHVKYIAGHLLNSQYGLVSLAGIEHDEKWNDLFAVMGQSESQDNLDYPSIGEIKTEWNALYKPTRDGLSQLSEEKLSQPPPSPFGKLANSAGELWAFINHHQAYHIGQISILRRVFGKEPMSYQ